MKKKLLEKLTVSQLRMVAKKNGINLDFEKYPIKNREEQEKKWNMIK